MKIAVATVSILLSLSASAFAEPCPHLDELNKPSSDKSVVFHSVREAALAGNTACQLLLGNMYGFGIGTQSNEMRSHRWYTIAALSGDVGARVELARFFGQDRQQNVYDPVLTYALLASREPLI
jgi:TPR repeat protein